MHILKSLASTAVALLALSAQANAQRSTPVTVTNGETTPVATENVTKAGIYRCFFSNSSGLAPGEQGESSCRSQTDQAFSAVPDGKIFVVTDVIMVPRFETSLTAFYAVRLQAMGGGISMEEFYDQRWFGGESQIEQFLTPLLVMASSDTLRASNFTTSSDNVRVQVTGRLMDVADFGRQ